MLIDRTRITFWLDDVCSEDIGIRVIDFPTFTGAEKRVTKYTIPGRNGDLTYWDGSFGNVSCEINCFIVSADKIDEALTAVNGWLAGSGYRISRGHPHGADHECRRYCNSDGRDRAVYDQAGLQAAAFF